MKDNLPLFSVLIANHNHSNYLMDAIGSVMAQTYTHWEIVLVDDGSTDNAESLYRELEQDSRIHVFRNGENKGCGFTKHRCLELAQGEICGFLDADDCLTEDALATMVEAHQKNPSCSLVYSQFYYANPQLKVISVSNQQCAIPKEKSFLTCNVICAISHFATLKKALYDKTEGIDSTLKIAEDIDLYLKLEEVGDTLFLPIPLYYYRIDTGCNVSLNQNNIGKTLGWEVIVKNAACKRRSLPVDDFVFNTIQTTLNNIRESSYQQGRQEGEQTIRNTKAYKIGKWVIRLFECKLGTRKG